MAIAPKKKEKNSLISNDYTNAYANYLQNSQANATTPKINVAAAQNQLNNYLAGLKRGEVGKNKYQSQYENAYNALVNREKFNYSQKNDPLYQQYEDMYTRNAKLAMQDTVGQVSALTGGYGNSYAETAGQAMYNQAMSGLNEKALDLYNAAMDRYNMEGNQLAQNYSAAANMYAGEQSDMWNRASLAEQQYQHDAALAYNQYQNELNRQMWEWEAGEQQRQANEANAYKLAAMQQSDYQYNTSLAEQQRQFDTNYDFNKWMADVNNEQWEKEYQRALANDDRAYQQWLEELKYQKEYDAQQQSNWDKNYNRAVLESDRAYDYQKAYDAQQQANWQTTFDRATLESDRAYDYQKAYDAQQQSNWNKNYNRAVLESDRAYDYQKAYDAMQQANWDKTFNRSVLESDRNYNYQQGRDAIEDAYRNKVFDRDVLESDRAFGYQQERDAVADSKWQQTMDYNNYWNAQNLQLQYDTLSWDKEKFERKIAQAEKEGDRDYAIQLAQIAEQRYEWEGNNAFKYASLAQEATEADKDRNLTKEGWRNTNEQNALDRDLTREGWKNSNAQNALDRDLTREGWKNTNTQNALDRATNEKLAGIKNSNSGQSDSPARLTYANVYSFLNTKGVPTSVIHSIASEGQFNSSKEMKKQYGTYDNYLQYYVDNYQDITKKLTNANNRKYS